MRVFVTDNHGTILYSVAAEQFDRVTLADGESSHWTDKFDTVRPEVYYDFKTNKFEPLKRMQLEVIGNKIRGVPHEASIRVDEYVVTIYDGEVALHGAPGAKRQVIIRCRHYHPEVVEVTL